LWLEKHGADLVEDILVTRKGKLIAIGRRYHRLEGWNARNDIQRTNVSLTNEMGQIVPSVDYVNIVPCSLESTIYYSDEGVRN